MSAEQQHRMSPEEIREVLKVVGRAWARSELPTGFPMNTVDKALTAYADLLERGVELETFKPDTPERSHWIRVSGPGRYLVVRVEDAE